MKDYEKSKLKAGLEIHQQLDTHKLFCNCPSILRNDEENIIKQVKRKLNPVVGETGEIDAAAMHEYKKGKTYIYNFYDTNCLVELDEEPPHEINKEALKTAIQIAHLLNCKIFPVTHVMRKTVIDGTNTSGFQRTALIGHDGYIETSEGKVGIETIAIEEDSARRINSDKENKTSTFNLDRLGIPLVEITTKPDLKSPEQIKEAALKIGEILRAAKVKRGIGTIRQDLNISTKNHPRIEIKGFQDPKIMIKTIETEIERQQKETNPESHVRKSLPDGNTKFLRPMPGAARMYPETDVPFLKIPKQLIDETKKNLPKLASEHKSYLEEFGLNNEQIKDIMKQKKIEQFKELIEFSENYSLIAKILTIFQKDIKNKEEINEEKADEIFNTDLLSEILTQAKEGKISENDVKRVMQKIAQGKSLKEATKKADINLEEEVKKIVEEKPGISQGAYMGLLMQKFRGQVSGKEISDELQKQIK